MLKLFINWLLEMTSEAPALSPSSPGEVTTLLSQWQEPLARERLFAIIYPDLKRIAEMRMRRERAGHTLQPTALVSEVFLHLVRNENVNWRNRAHFLAIASEAMRRILVDCARSRRAQKRGSGQVPIVLDFEQVGGTHELDQIVEVDILLSELAAQDARAAKVVELRYFGGLTFEEAGEILGVNERTVKRDWQMARAWLFNALTRGKP